MKRQNARLPRKNKQASTATRQEQQVVEVEAHWEGPLPPPEHLRQFGNVVENGAERIVSAWEEETRHRRTMERRELGLLGADLIIGKLCALVFVLAALAASAYMASVGAQWAAIILGGGTISSVVWAFVQGRKNKSD